MARIHFSIESYIIITRKTFVLIFGFTSPDFFFALTDALGSKKVSLVLKSIFVTDIWCTWRSCNKTCFANEILSLHIACPWLPASCLKLFSLISTTLITAPLKIGLLNGIPTTSVSQSSMLMVVALASHSGWIRRCNPQFSWCLDCCLFWLHFRFQGNSSC